MSSHLLTKEKISWVTGISVIIEEDDSRQVRLNEAQAYYHSREDLATQAVTDLVGRGIKGSARDSVRWFAIHTRWERTYQMPKSLPRKRWLSIGDYVIPLPPQRCR